MTPSLVILTMALHPDGVRRAVVSVAAAPSPWPTEHRIVWHHGAPDPSRATVAPRITAALRALPAGAWVVAVDDDNLLHPDLPARLAAAVAERPDALAVVLGQARRDFGGYLAPSLPPTPGRIDGGQVALRADAAGLVAWRAGPMGDGEYLAALYAATPPGRWLVIDEPLTYHNAQEWL